MATYDYGKVSELIYAIIALVAAVGLCAWLLWRNRGLRQDLEKAQARNQALREDRAIRQNLQRVLDRREAEIRRLRARVAAFESDYQEMESRASDLNMSLFKESGLRILAEKEDGVKRMKMEQLEHQLSEARNKLKAQEEAAGEKLRAALQEHDSAAARTEAQLRGEINRLNEEIRKRDNEIGRLQTLNARRLARKAQAETGGLDQVTLEDVLKVDKPGAEASREATEP